MIRKRYIGLGLVAGVVVLVALVGSFIWMNREPRYQGKPLSEWLGEEGAASAVREMGPRAVPFLTDRILAKEPRWKERLVGWVNQVPWLDWESADTGTERRRAVEAFRMLGPEAQPAVPKLIEGLRHPWSRPAAIQALQSIGPGARRSIPALLDLLSGEPNTPNMRILRACQRIGVDADAVPALIEVVHADEGQPSWLAVSMLGEIGTEAEAALVKTATNEGLSSRVRCHVVWALGLIGSVLPSTVERLVDLACDGDQPLIVRQRAVNALGRIGLTDEAVFRRVAKAVNEQPEWELEHTIRNGDFENPALEERRGFVGERKYSPAEGTLSGWFAYQGLVNIRGRPEAPGGSQIMELGPRTPPGCLGQTVITVPEQEYRLSFFAAPGRNRRLHVGIGSFETTLNWGGGARGSSGGFGDGGGGFGNGGGGFPGGGGGFGNGGIGPYDAPFHRYRFEFRADSWLTTVTFCGVESASYGPMIDKVVVGPVE